MRSKLTEIKNKGNSKGITLVALVITIVIIIILSTIAINFTFGENGLITRAQQAVEMSVVSRILEQLEMAKGSAYIDGAGEIDTDHYFDILEEEGIINDKETDVVDNGDGTYDVTTEGDRVFEVTLEPNGDFDIEYVGKNDEPRISSINVTDKTENSVTVEVVTKNVENAEYTYSYKKTDEGEEAWQEAGTGSSNTFTFSDLENNTSYDIKVTVKLDDGTTIEKTITVQLGTGAVEIPDGTITFGQATWQGDGTASMEISTTESGYTLQYQIGSTEGQWTTITRGQSITGLKHGDTVYAKITDGVNDSEIQQTTIEDKTVPEVNVTAEEKTSNSITVSVSAVDKESGMSDNVTYTYSIKQSGSADYSVEATDISQNTYTFSDLQSGISYDIKVEAKADKAGNIGTGYLAGQTTTDIPGGEDLLEDGTITVGDTVWADGKASIDISTDSGYQIEYQINGTSDGSWNNIGNSGTVSELKYGDTVNIRLTDGTNHGDFVTVTIGDEIAPIVNVTLGTSTSNSIKVNVTASDNESGMAASPTYTYYIKQSSEEDTAYVAKANNITQNTYTFTGLTQGTSYDVKVEVTGDNAGNTGAGYLAGQTTATIPDGSGEDVEEGAITFGEVSWSSNKASISVSTNTSYQIEYQVGGITEGSWTGIANNGTISNLNYGDTVYARLTDGVNHGEYASVSITETIAPQAATISLSGTSTDTDGSVTANVTLTDNESGVDVTGSKWIYNTTSGNIGTDEASYTNSFTTNPEELTLSTDTAGTYYLHVLTKDVAGNKIETVSEAVTVEEAVPDMGDAKPNPGEDGPEYGTNTPVSDDQGNTVVIPGGFHLDADSGTSVEDGIVIEDGDGNQFVWIPTGTYNVTEAVDNDGTKDGKMTNNLSRRTFTSSGATEVSGDNGIQSGSYYFYGEGNSSSVAYSQIGAFKDSVSKNGGFYIGRYEQGTGNVCKAGVAPYTNITRDTAKSQAEAMYSGNSYVVSELISSYAWDTALNFICQTNTAGYTLATTTSSSYGNINTGSKKNTGVDANDNYSNIHDLLGNCLEWTTEYSSSSSYPCVNRGGFYNNGSYCAAIRYSGSASTSRGRLSARLQLYVK